MMQRGMQSLFLILVLSSLMNRASGAFKPPGLEVRLSAIGSSDSLLAVGRRALEPDEDFKPIPAPGSDDWLASHREPGQTFADYLESQPNKPDNSRRIIYLQPVGDFQPKQSPSLEKLRDFAAIYFQMEVKTLPPVLASEQIFTTRLNPRTKNLQILTGDVLAFLKKRLPLDAYCVLAITMEDLYPETKWNFVFGQASLRERVGVFSFARYAPAFYGQKHTKNYDEVLLRRSCKVLVHEGGHMFGVTHCIYFSCIMNGSNHLEESDRRPFHLCPVCLHKFYHGIGFDFQKREKELEAFYRKVKFNDEAKWTRRRIEKILSKVKD